MNKRSEPSDLESTEYAKFKALRLKRASPKPDGRDAYAQLRSLMLQRLTDFIEQDQDALDDVEMRPLLLKHLYELLVEERIVLTVAERGNLFEDLFGEIMSTRTHSDGNKPS